jgi:hypothetical protein
MANDLKLVLEAVISDKSVSQIEKRVEVVKQILQKKLGNLKIEINDADLNKLTQSYIKSLDKMHGQALKINQKYSAQYANDIGDSIGQSIGKSFNKLEAEGLAKAKVLKQQLSLQSFSPTDTTKPIKTNVEQAFNSIHKESQKYANDIGKLIGDSIGQSVTLNTNSKTELQLKQKKTLEIEKQIALYKQEHAIQLQNIQSQYKSFYGKPEFKSQIEDINKLKNNISIDNYTESVKKTDMATKQLSANLKQAKVESENFANGLVKNAGKMLTWAVVGTAIFGATRAIKDGINTIFELDKSLTNLKKVSDELGTSQGLKQFTVDVNNMAIAVGHTTTAAINAVTEFKKLGYSLQESQDLARNALIYSNIGDIGIDDATKSLTSTLKGFNLAASDTKHIIDAVNEVNILAS